MTTRVLNVVRNQSTPQVIRAAIRYRKVELAEPLVASGNREQTVKAV